VQTVPDATAKPVSPLREMLAIAIPTILQMASYTIQQFTDIFMLAKVGDTHATAAAMGGLATFCFISFGFGVLMLVNAMAGQAFGAKKFNECGAHLWQGIWLALAYSAVVTPAIFLGRPMFVAFGHSDELIRLEYAYFAIAMSFVVIKMLATAVGQFLLAVDRPNIVLLSAATGVIVNIFANWVLIYGKLGAPAMGVAGAAWGTNIGVTCELLILAVVAFGPKVRAAYNTFAWRFDRAKFFELLKIGLPSGFQVTADVFAWTIFLFGIMNMYGEKALAANNYMIQYMKVSFMPAFGFGVAVSVLVARYVGAKEFQTATHRAHLGFKIAGAYMFACGIVFVVFSEWLLRFFTIDPEIIRIGKLLFIFCAIYQVFDAMFIIYSNALRGVKDTFWPATIQVVMCWSLVVGGSWLVARYAPHWGVGGPWTLGSLYGILLGLYLLVRFGAGRWRQQYEAHTEPAPEIVARTAAAVEPLVER